MLKKFKIVSILGILISLTLLSACGVNPEEHVEGNVTEITQELEQELPMDIPMIELPEGITGKAIIANDLMTEITNQIEGLKLTTAVSNLTLP